MPEGRPIDPDRTIDAPGSHLCGVAWDGSKLWHSDGQTDRIYRLSPTDGQVLRELPCPDVRTDLAYEEGILWQVVGEPKLLRLIDTDSGASIEERPLPRHSQRVCGLDVGPDDMWIGLKGIGRIHALDRDLGKIRRTYEVEHTVDGLAVLDETVWFTSFSDRILGGIDRQTGEMIARYQLPGKPTGMAFDGRAFWYSDFADDCLRAVTVDAVGVSTLA